MTDRIEFEPAPDPLYRRVPLPHELTLPVLGVPVRFRSNARAVIDAAEAAFGAWRVLEARPDLVEAEGVTVQLVVHEGDEGEGPHAPVIHRVLDGFRVLYHSPGSVACADPWRREGVGFVTPALVADREHFRYLIVEGMTLALVTHRDRQPFHASALVEDGAALLLAGPSGVGKSTLAYAGVRAGLRVLAEDTVHLQSRPALRVWGLPGYLHLPVDARDRFPELADERATLLANGKRKLALDLGRRGALPVLPVADRAGVCLVERGTGEPGIEAVGASELLGRLTQGLETGFDLFADTIEEPLRELSSRGGWRFRIPRDPRDAIPPIREMLERVRAGAIGTA